MTENIIAMAGTSCLDIGFLRSVAGEFRWVADEARDLREAALLQDQRKTVAVLFHRDSFGEFCSWADAIGRLKKALPDAHLVACYALSESIDWTELSEAGAFAALGLPLRENELRQVLGFVLEAEQRLWDAGEQLASAAPPRRRNAVHHVRIGRMHAFRSRGAGSSE